MNEEEVSETRLWMEVWWFQTTPCLSPCPWSWIWWSRCCKCSRLGCTDNLRHQADTGVYRCPAFMDACTLLFVFCISNLAQLWMIKCSLLGSQLLSLIAWCWRKHTHTHWGRVIFIPLILPALTRRCHCSLAFPSGADTCCFLPALMIPPPLPRSPLRVPFPKCSEQLTELGSRDVHRLTCQINTHTMEESPCFHSSGIQRIQTRPCGLFYTGWGTNGHDGARGL